MGKKENGPEERQIVKIEDMSLEETQLTEQLYTNAGLDPVVEVGLKDYEERLKQEDKLISKVFGPRGSDIKGYGEAVAKRVAFAVYNLLNRQYGGKVGDLRSHIMALQEERDRANARYDELMGRVVGILGEEYKELRTDSKAFMERLTATLGEDLKESKIDHQALAEKLADIDGLRAQIQTLGKEKERLKEDHESQVAALKGERDEAVSSLESQIESMKKEHEETTGSLKSQIADMESEKAALAGDLGRLKEEYGQLQTAVAALAESIPHEEIGEKLGEELHNFILQDSKVPHAVIKGVGQFIDIRKYLKQAVVKGSEEAARQAREKLQSA